MKRTVLILLALTISFGFGFAMHAIVSTHAQPAPYKKVTGIGGIFFKSKDPAKLKLWYHDQLGLNTDKFGTTFKWYQGADSTRLAYTQWSPFKSTTNYFEPSESEFMINYRVADLTALVVDLKAAGVKLTDTIESYSYGKFVHIMDPEGHKIELWQPNDIEYGKIEGGVTK